MPFLNLADAESLVSSVLEGADTSPDNARSVARALVAAEADGLKGHGLSRVASYAAQARTGKVDGRAIPSADRRRPGILAVDAAHGFAYPALDLVVAELPAVVRQQGVAAAPIRRSQQCGVAGRVVERLADAGLVALLFANTPAAMAPTGGRRPVFGTNPIAFACPLPGQEPLVIDLALSKVARGNIIAAKQRGEPIPEGWALDGEGRPTTDPDAALAGTMIPSGDAKGTALALMVELLAAGLTGARYAADASSFIDTKGGPPATGQLVVAFDPTAIGGAGTTARFTDLAISIEDQEGARLPGRRRIDNRRRAERQGVAVDDAFVLACRTQ